MSVFRKIGIRPSRSSQVIMAVLMLGVVILTVLAVTVQGKWYLLPIGILVFGILLFQFVRIRKEGLVTCDRVIPGNSIQEGNRWRSPTC